MTILTNIQEYTSYSSTDITNAITASTRLCLALNITDDVSIEKGAIWLLERQVKERKARTDDTVVVPSMQEFDTYIKSLSFEEKQEGLIVERHTSPHFRNGTNWYDPQR